MPLLIPYCDIEVPTFPQKYNGSVGMITSLKLI